MHCVQGQVEELQTQYTVCPIINSGSSDTGSDLKGMSVFVCLL